MNDELAQLVANSNVIALRLDFVNISNNNLHAGLLLSQLYYWYTKSNGQEFYKTSQELQNECHLSRREFDGARHILVSNGSISITKRDKPTKTYYTINEKMIVALCKKLQGCTKRTIVSHDCTKRAAMIVQNVQSSINNTETTTKNRASTPPIVPQTKKFDSGMGECYNDEMKPNHNEPTPTKLTRHIAVSENACRSTAIADESSPLAATLTNPIPTSSARKSGSLIIANKRDFVFNNDGDYSETVKKNAFENWKMIALERRWQFTEDEWCAIRVYAEAKPTLTVATIERNLLLAIKWANEGLEIADTFIQSADLVKLQKPFMARIVDAKGNRVYDAEKIRAIRNRKLIDVKDFE